MKQLNITITKCKDCPYLESRSFSDCSWQRYCNYPNVKDKSLYATVISQGHCGGKVEGDDTHLKTIPEWCPL